jgi:acyl-coenzyme A thioesterase PaaI-like protein
MLIGRGKAIKVGRSLAFAEASIEDSEGRLLAKAQSRFSVRGTED